MSWFGTVGADNGVTKEIQLLDPELIGPNAENNFVGPTHVVEHNHPDYDDIPDLIEGSIYTVTWTMTDLAGNTSLATYQSTNVEFDATLPSVNLVASRYLVGFPYTLTITATFSEPMEATLSELLDPDLVPPHISIDLQPLDENSAPFYDFENITMTKDIHVIDSTVFYIEIEIPDCEWDECSGTVAVSIAAQDRAGNPLPGGTIDFENPLPGGTPDTLLRIDNLSPTCNLQYVNVTQDWLDNEGKGQDMIQIRGDFNKTIGLDPPMISGQFLGSTDIFTDLLPDESINEHTTHFW